MIDELTELLDIAMDREIVSQAFYIAGQKKTQDPGAIQLMTELAEQEQKHYEWIKNYKDTRPTAKDWSPKSLPDLMISEYLIDTKIPEQAGLQDVITAAMKREQYSMDFYAKLKQVINSDPGKRLCERLIQEEQKHKTKLETFYDDLFNQEN